MDNPLPRLLTAGTGPLHLAAVTELLHPPGPVPAAGVLSAGRIPALAACYHATRHARTPFVFGWLRPAAEGPVTVLTSSPPTTAGLVYPPAARGTLLDPGAAAALLTPLPVWTAVTLAADTLITTDTAGGAGIEDALLDVWAGAPFGWLIHAIPLTAEEIAEEAALTAEAERDARTRSGSPAYQARADRAGARDRELRAGETTGVWRVHLLAAGPTAGAALGFAGLLTAAIDLTAHGYAATPTSSTASLDTLLAGAPATVAGTPLLATLAQPPAGEIPGIRIRPRSTFAVTAPATGRGLHAGTVLDRSGHPAAALTLDEANLARHTFVTGATGSGKTTTIQHLLDQATTAGVAWLVIEPAKAEYRDRVDAAVLRVGDLDAPLIGLNPLQPAAGFPLRTHADMVKALLVAAFRGDEPFPQIIATAVDACFRATGWDLTLSQPRTPGLLPRWPTLTDLRTAAQAAVRAAGYGREIEADVSGFIDVRLASLTTGTSGSFLTATKDLDMDRLLRRNVIIELEDVGDDTDKAFLMGALLMRLTQHLRTRHRQQQPGTAPVHITVVEEAHRLLRRPDRDGPTAHAVETFAAMLAEIRAYNEALIIADQIPAKLIPDTIKNTATKIVHRLPARDDRDAVGATMNITDDQSTYLVTLPPGTAAVFTEGMHTPVLTRIPRPDPTRRTVRPYQGEQPAISLREHATAHALADRVPAVAVWADLAVLAHLIGLATPAPGPHLARTLAAMDQRERTILLDTLLWQSVCARTNAIAATHSPHPFTQHLTADLHHQLTDRTGCPDPASQWILPAYRYNPIRRALLLAVHHDSDAPRHPDSDTWQAATGTDITGSTAREQLTTVTAWSARLEAQLPPTVTGALMLGQPARLPAILATAVTDPGWPGALTAVLAELVIPGGWPTAYLLSGTPLSELP